MTDKQTAAVAKVAEGRKDVAFETQEVDGVVLMTAAGWPTVKVTKGGGLDLVEVRSFEETKETGGRLGAVLRGDALLVAQQERDAKKAAAKVTAQQALATAEEEDGPKQ